MVALNTARSYKLFHVFTIPSQSCFLFGGDMTLRVSTIYNTQHVENFRMLSICTKIFELKIFIRENFPTQKFPELQDHIHTYSYTLKVK